MQDLLQPFLKNNYSMQQIRSRFGVLKSHLLSESFNSKDEVIISDSDKKWLENLGADFFKQFTPLNVNQQLANLEKAILNIQPLTIYVAFEYPNNEIDRLGEWIRDNLGSNMVFDIKFNGNLIGGSAFSWKGIHKDYSLKSSLEQNKNLIIDSIRKYIK